MALDSRYMIAGGLDTYFVDKDTGLPLAGGILTFYSDNNRTDLKNIYTLSGSPPNYSYVPLPNPLTLSAVGNIVDNSGNNVIVYYFPFDANGNPENYYVKVTGPIPGLVPQYTREAWPNFTAETQANPNIVNYIPNGQFLAHINIPATHTTVAGQITQPITVIAAGGWTFERPSGSAATDIVTFPRYNEAISNPTFNPRFAASVHTTVPDPTDTFKYIALRFDDVNKFSSDVQEYTVSFSGQTLNGSSTIVNVLLIKHFGTGGSPTADQTTILTQFTLTPTEQIFNFPFVFGSNESFVLGTNNDDWVKIVVALPTSLIIQPAITDAILTVGSVNITTFPPTTNRDFLDRIYALSRPLAADGRDLYLPLRTTPDGIEPDTSQIGKVYASTTALQVGELLLDNTQYETAAVSSDGIPYSRLQAKWFTSPYPLYGTGKHYITANIFATLTTHLWFNVNSKGSVTVITDGAIPTGFTFATIHTPPSMADYGFTAYLNGAHSIIAISNTTGLGIVTGVVAGTSGFTVADVRNVPATPADAVNYIFSIDVGTNPAAGTYFGFHDGATNRYMWFTVDGAGADPAPGGTGIKLDLLSTYTIADTANLIKQALTGLQISTVITGAASTITAGSYFAIYSDNQGYYVWITKNGIGTDPNPPNLLPIPVNVLNGDTAIQVASKIQVAVNSKYFNVPNWQGLFLRGTNGSTGFDKNVTVRLGIIPYTFGNTLGTYEIDKLLSHNHIFGTTDNATGLLTHNPAGTGDTTASSTIGTTPLQQVTISYTGQSETSPINANVNWVVKY